MKAEIIAVGTEVLMGQVVNSNAAFISEELSKLGVDVYFHTVVGDNPIRMQQVIELAKNRSDLIIISGGLGPTKDDITKSIVAKTLGLKLHKDEASYDKIVSYYKNSNRRMPESNINQAMMIENSQKIPNDNGMAPGVFLKDDGRLYAMVPGVPTEMKRMVSNYLMDLIKNEIAVEGVLESKILRLYNISESQLAESIDEIVEAQSNPTIAIYVDGFEPTIRISAKAQSSKTAMEMISRTESELRAVVGEKVYGTGSHTIKEKVLELMNSKNFIINLIESGAKNIFSNAFVHSNGSSKIISHIHTFTNHDKLKSYFSLEQLDEKAIKELLKQEVTKLDSNAAILVLGDEDWITKSNQLQRIELHMMFGNEYLKETIDLSYREVIEDDVFETAIMSKLYSIL